MHVKRFVAATLVEAIQQVKAELGPDAMIVSQRSIRRDGGLFGLLGRSVVEVTWNMNWPISSSVSRYSWSDVTCSGGRGVPRRMVRHGLRGRTP